MDLEKQDITFFDKLLGKDKLKHKINNKIDTIENLQNDKKELEKSISEQKQLKKKAITEKQKAYKERNKIKSKISNIKNNINNKNNNNTPNNNLIFNIDEFNSIFNYLNNIQIDNKDLFTYSVLNKESIPLDLKNDKNVKVQKIKNNTPCIILKDKYNIFSILIKTVYLNENIIYKNNNFKLSKNYFEPDGNTLFIVSKKNKCHVKLFNKDKKEIKNKIFDIDNNIEKQIIDYIKNDINYKHSIYIYDNKKIISDKYIKFDYIERKQITASNNLRNMFDKITKISIIKI